MKYGIAMFPSKNLQDKVNSYRKRYDPRYALIPPHITLKYPFELDNNQLNELIKQTHVIAKSIPPVQIKITKVSSFHPANNVVYFKVEPNLLLKNLHDYIQEVVPKSKEEYQFVPHITIGQDLSDEEHADILQSLKMKQIQFEEIVDRFQLLYQLENGSWTVYETFHLGKED